MEQLGFTNFTKSAKCLCLLVALGLPGSNLLFCQAPIATTGTVTGHVRGPGGVSVPGATVQLTNPQTGERKETWTDEEGNYTFTALKPGNYRLDVSLVGFRPDSRQPVPVASEKPLKVNVALVVAVPGGEAPQQAQTAARPAGNRATGQGGGRIPAHCRGQWHRESELCGSTTGGGRHFHERQQLIPAGRRHG